MLTLTSRPSLRTYLQNLSFITSQSIVRLIFPFTTHPNPHHLKSDSPQYSKTSHFTAQVTMYYIKQFHDTLNIFLEPTSRNLQALRKLVQSNSLRSNFQTSFYQTKIIFSAQRITLQILSIRFYFGWQIRYNLKECCYRCEVPTKALSVQCGSQVLKLI